MTVSATPPSSFLVMRTFRPEPIDLEFGSRGGIIFLLERPAELPRTNCRIFYPSKEPARPTILPAPLPPFRIDHDRDFLEIACWKIGGSRDYPPWTPIPYGEVVRIGALAVAYIPASAMADYLLSDFLPWRCHVDILLLGGVLQETELPPEFFHKPTPWATFATNFKYYGITPHSYGRSQHKLVGLGKNPKVYAHVSPSSRSSEEIFHIDLFSITGQPKDPKDHRQGPNITRDKEGFLLEFLQLKYGSPVRRRLESLQERDKQDPAVGRIVQEAARLAASYLARVARFPEAPVSKKQEWLAEIWGKIGEQKSREEMALLVQAFVLFLQPLVEEPELADPYR